MSHKPLYCILGCKTSPVISRVSPSLLRFSSNLSVKQEEAFKKISGLKKKKKEDKWFRNLENLRQHLTRGTAVIYDVFQIGM